MVWHDALNEALKEYRDERYCLGTRDCVHFVARYLELAGSPVDLPAYESPLEAARILRRDLRALMSERLGDPEDPSPGSPVLCTLPRDDNAIEVPAVFNGSFCLAFLETHALCRVDAHSIVAAWSPPDG